LLSFGHSVRQSVGVDDVSGQLDRASSLFANGPGRIVEPIRAWNVENREIGAGFGQSDRNALTDAPAAPAAKQFRLKG